MLDGRMDGPALRYLPASPSHLFTMPPSVSAVTPASATFFGGLSMRETLGSETAGKADLQGQSCLQISSAKPQVLQGGGSLSRKAERF